MDKWRRNKQARSNIAKQWLKVRLWDMFGVSMRGKRNNPVNFAEAVWLKNKDDVPEASIKSYQKAVVQIIRIEKESTVYQSLLDGTASDELIQETLDEYERARGEWGAKKGRRR